MMRLTVMLLVLALVTTLGAGEYTVLRCDATVSERDQAAVVQAIADWTDGNPGDLTNYVGREPWIICIDTERWPKITSNEVAKLKAVLGTGTGVSQGRAVKGFDAVLRAGGETSEVPTIRPDGVSITNVVREIPK